MTFTSVESYFNKIRINLYVVRRDAELALEKDISKKARSRLEKIHDKVDKLLQNLQKAE